MSGNPNKPTDNIIFFDRHHRAAKKWLALNPVSDELELRTMTPDEGKAVVDAMAELEALEDAHVLDSDQ